ncbi:citrate lyase holo-[acyl-carrier protein] synthase [Trichloromonas sp.]|uniref:citrate lyase holo-[acyl-carrier protein] synthase n=1 Tax=Trichloromonas sp. TaxID=3069249 RepID=UPI003D814AC5
MWYAELKTDLLAARDARQAVLEDALSLGMTATLLLSLGIPGDNKRPPGAQRLFQWAHRSLLAAYPGLTEAGTGEDLLGPYAILAGPVDPGELKRGCIELESSFPVSRLLDVDVYTATGTAVDRELLQLEQRRCLLCDAPAKECIRLGRHPHFQLVNKANELLQPFSN